MSEPPPPASRDRQFIERAVRLGIIGGAVVAVLVALLWVLKSALTPLAVAFVLAYLFDPLIDRFEARRVPRGVAIFILLGLAGIALVAAAGWLVPRMQAELVGLSQSLPGYLDRSFAWLSPRLDASLGFEMPGSVREGIERLREHQLETLFDRVSNLLGRIVTFFAGTLGALVGLLVIPVIAYYLLVEFDRLKLAALQLVPAAYQPTVERQATRIDQLVAGFIRGQLVVALIQGALYGIGFSAIGVDLAAVIGMVAGMLSIIPYVGGAVAIAIASVMCMLEFGLDLHLLLVVGWYSIVQTFEGLFLTPRIVGRSVGMHPVTVIVALLIGGDLLGFLGLLVAVPLAAVVQVFAQDAVAAWKASTAYSRS